MKALGTLAAGAIAGIVLALISLLGFDWFDPQGASHFTRNSGYPRGLFMFLVFGLPIGGIGGGVGAGIVLLRLRRRKQKGAG